MNEQEKPMKPDLSAEVTALCSALGLDKTAVTRIELHPTHATVERFKLNDSGAFYVHPDTGRAATETLEFDLAAT